MKLIILLIAFGLERYANIGDIIKRFSWFDGYLKLLRSVIKSNAAWNGYMGISLVIVPIVLLVLVLYLLMASWFFGAMGMILSLLVIMYCLGPDDLYHQVQSYFHAREDNQDPKEILHDFLGPEIPTNEAECHRAMSSAILLQANERLFAILFWFVVLGPVGLFIALTYRLSTLLRKKSANTQSEWQSVHNEVVMLQKILDWIPARVTALLYTLVGHFSASFPTWLRYAFQGLDSSNDLVLECATQSMGLDPKDVGKASLAENQEALGMVDRALVVFLAIVAIATVVTIYAWLW